MIQLTICIPLSGRTACWHKLAAFLKDQQIDKKSCHLYLMNTSDQVAFHQTVRTWLNVRGHDYRTLTYQQYPANMRDFNAADAPRDIYFQFVNETMVKIYKRMQRRVSGEYTLIIEDDIIPPLNVFHKLRESLIDGVFSVSGAYPIRNAKAWTAWSDFTHRKSLEPGIGVEQVVATGFGCLLLRTADFQQSQFTWANRPSHGCDWPWGYDMEFFQHIQKSSRRVLVDWDVRCDHLDKHGQPWRP